MRDIVRRNTTKPSVIGTARINPAGPRWRSRKAADKGQQAAKDAFFAPYNSGSRKLACDKLGNQNDYSCLNKHGPTRFY